MLAQSPVLLENGSWLSVDWHEDRHRWVVTHQDGRLVGWLADTSSDNLDEVAVWVNIQDTMSFIGYYYEFNEAVARLWSWFKDHN